VAIAHKRLKKIDSLLLFNQIYLIKIDMYKIYKNVAICLIALLSFSQMQAQDTQVSGLVKDETGAGLPGVNVLIKGTATGTTTDAAGKYALSLTDANSTLIFSFIGYTSEEIAVNGRSVIDMSMLPDIT
jgi:hypothetical protein